MRSCLAILFLLLAVNAQAENKEKPMSASPDIQLERVTDLTGKEINPFSNPSNRAVVLIFISIECPICNRYAPEIQRLADKFGKEGVAFWLVQPDPSADLHATRAYLKDFGYSMSLLRDTKHALVRMTGAKVTPEAVVFAPGKKQIYRGRIDDRYVDFGKARPVPVHRELKTVLEDVLAGRKTGVVSAPAIGCFIGEMPSAKD